MLRRTTIQLNDEQRRLSPAIQLRLMLTHSKRSGVAFDVAWRTAWKRIAWPHDTAHRQQWKAMLGDPKAAKKEGLTQAEIKACVRAWSEAYEDIPVPDHVRACVKLDAILDRPEELTLIAA